MPEADIQQYVSVMKEIKLRIEVINKFLSGQLAAHYVPTTIETVGLQFRKTFELIAFASLAANREEYSKAYTDFEKHWEAAKLVRFLRRVNPTFYPKPVLELPSTDPRAVKQLQDRAGDYLTEAELVEAHGRCGSLMHAANPYGAPIQYDYFQNQFRNWLLRTMNLLNTHQVHLPGDPGFWLVHMQEHGHNDVAFYRFSPPPKQ